MAVQEIYTKSALQKSGIPGVAYVINPYIGCTHGCVYCYARFMKRFTGHTDAWGTFLDAKINAPEMLKNQLKRRKTPLKEVVFLSSVTDPYLPVEAKYHLTRDLLEVLLEYQVPVSILTKSDLVLRDLDLFRRFKQCSVGLSLMTTDDILASRFEPRAPVSSRRIQALKTLKTCDIETYAFISPFLPKLSNIEELVTRLHGAVDEIGVEAINTRGGNWTGVEAALRQFYPELLADCHQRAKDEDYWDIIERQARELATQANISFMGFFRHSR